MEGSPLGSRLKQEPKISSLEWDLKGRISSKQNKRSRRYSGSYITTYREESNRSFRSNITTVSTSTASSPGCHLKYEIDPSTYSFNTALQVSETSSRHCRRKALQARSGYMWECLSPDGFALNSKWNEAEKYICNPLSGQVPVECLSSNTLSKRPFPNLAAARITMSAPLPYSSRRFGNCPKPKEKAEEVDQKTNSNTKTHHLLVQEKEMLGDVEDQAPPIHEGEPICCESGDEKRDMAILNNSMEKVEEVKATEEEQETKRERHDKEEMENKKIKKKEEESAEERDHMCRCSIQSGCFLSWKNVWMRKSHREKHNQYGYQISP